MGKDPNICKNKDHLHSKGNSDKYIKVLDVADIHYEIILQLGQGTYGRGVGSTATFLWNLRQGRGTSMGKKHAPACAKNLRHVC